MSDPTYPAGATPDLYLDVDPADNTTTAAVTLDAPTGPNQTLTVTPGAAVAGSTARRLTAAGANLNEAGTWVATWTVTGTGHGTATQTIIVTAVRAADATPTFNPATAVGRVRLLISDLDPANLLYTDAQLTAFLAINGEAVRLAAAQALLAIAGNEVMVSKVIRTQDLQVDGAKVAAELRAMAAQYRAEHEDGYGNEGDTGSGFTIVDYDPYPLPAEYAEWTGGYF